MGERRRTFLRAASSLILVGSLATAGANRAGDPEVNRLIDRLTQVGEEGLGYQATAWGAGFIPVEMEPEFRGGILGSQRPVVDPAMRELVRKGVAALPDLIDHLSDRREAKIRMRGFMGMWHSDEYDPRRRPPPRYVAGRSPVPELEMGSPRRPVDSYTLRVGDLCFVAIGQIVNRDLNATRYQPSLCLVINSPVETPELAERVREDWGGLTAEEHKRSLMRDALAPQFNADPLALTRLWFYYPEDGEALALKLLGRPLYDDAVVVDFLDNRLVKEKDADRWQLLIEGFRRDRGSRHADAIPFLLRWLYWGQGFSEPASLLEAREVAARILAKLYADVDPDTPPFLNAATPREQAELIEALAPFPSPRVDDAVHRVYLSIRREEFPSDDARYELDRLAEACVRRLFGRGYSDVILPYCRLKAEEVRGRADRFIRASFWRLGRCIPLSIFVADPEDPFPGFRGL